MDVGTYLKRKMAILSLALARVEKSSLNQVSDAVGSEGSTNETMELGSMADSMLKGVATLEVKEMRWRMYKILNASNNLKTKITGYEDDLPKTETYSVEDKVVLSSILKDDFDPYDVELVVTNDEMVKSTTEALSNETLTIHADDVKVENRSDVFELVGAEIEGTKNLGEISFENMVSSLKSEKSIFIERELRPKFELEHYTKKLFVRNISEDSKLLEFYVSKYSDEYDRKSRFFIKEIGKAKKNPRASDMLDINKIGFITNKTIGAKNGMEYIYQIEKFDKIVEFNGCFVIKFIAKPLINGESIFEKHKMLDLDDRYENKKSKNL